MKSRELLKRLAKGPVPVSGTDAPPSGEGDGACDLWRQWLADGVVESRNGMMYLTDAGRMQLRRMLVGADDAFRGQHQSRQNMSSDLVGQVDVDADAMRTQAGRQAGPVVDLGESPLAWLAARKDAKGRALLDRHQVEAGERLRQDYTFAGLMPRFAGGWRTERISGGRARPGVDLDDHILAARRRVEQALSAVGGGLAPVLVDVCCLLKGLETVEKERGWPPRSGKVVLGLALSSLSEHYRLGVSGVRPKGSRQHPDECARPST